MTIKTSATFEVAMVLLLAAATAIAEPDPAPEAGAAEQAGAPAEVGSVRPAGDADLVWKEWKSPVTFEVDASWLRSAPLNDLVTVEDLPTFYCDDVTVDWLEAKKIKTPRTEVLTLKLHIALSARRQEDDKVVAMEFSLLVGEQKIALGRFEDMELDAGESDTWWADYRISPETMQRVAAEGAKPRLQVTMIVRVN